MTENLRLTGVKTLHASDSNVTSDWNLPAVNTSFPTSCVDTAYNMSSGNTTYGNYYNWYAATAGSGTCAMTSGSASSSICPKGWELPTSGSSGQFQTLYDNYGSSTLMRGTPANIVLSGMQTGSSTINQGSYGYYWSSTARGSTSAYNLYIDSSTIDPKSYGSGRYIGFTVRCVAQ